MLVTTPEEFSRMPFCAEHKYCNRCRNDQMIRVAIMNNHGISYNGEGCPLGLKWDTAPKELPATSRWECPGEPEHEHWKIHIKPKMDQLQKDIEYENRFGRKAFLEFKIAEDRADEYEKEELAVINGKILNQCRLIERVGCNCKGGGWVVCHYPGFLASGAPNVNSYTPAYLGLDPRARAEVSAEVALALAGDTEGLDRAGFVAALQAACFDHGRVTPALKQHCDQCWDMGAFGTRPDVVPYKES